MIFLFPIFAIEDILQGENRKACNRVGGKNRSFLSIMKSLNIEELRTCNSGFSFHSSDKECQGALENIFWGTIGILGGVGTGLVGALSFAGGVWSFAKGTVGIPNYCVYV
ncbi:MAG: hypothetical protein IJ721_00630 [Bacteroidales bacterium]|nr:hypothetical protein [Bacteroidales bacterium]